MPATSKPRVAVTWLVSLVLLACCALPVASKDRKARHHAKLDSMAAKSLQHVLSKGPGATSLYEQSYGYAAFDNIKLAFGVSGGGGSGVAVAKSGRRVYMRMATAGLGFGLGGQKYQVVFLFQTEEAFKSFVDKGWQADVTAQAAAADKGANAVASFKNGIAYYQITDKGLIASADISGTKYWKSEDSGE